MFCQLVTVDFDRYAEDESKLQLQANPPDGLIAAVAWRDGDSARTRVLWDSPAAAGDFAEMRVMPLLEAGEIAPAHPERLVMIEAFVRSGAE